MNEVVIQPQNGQSNYDLTFQSIGSLDGFVSFLNSNSINSSSNQVNKVIKYNTNSVLSRLISGNVFSTRS